MGNNLSNKSKKVYTNSNGIFCLPEFVNIIQYLDKDIVTLNKITKIDKLRSKIYEKNLRENVFCKFYNPLNKKYKFDNNNAHSIDKLLLFHCLKGNIITFHYIIKYLQYNKKEKILSIYTRPPKIINISDNTQIKMFNNDKYNTKRYTLLTASILSKNEQLIMNLIYCFPELLSINSLSGLYPAHLLLKNSYFDSLNFLGNIILDSKVKNNQLVTLINNKEFNAIEIFENLFFIKSRCKTNLYKIFPIETIHLEDMLDGKIVNRYLNLFFMCAQYITSKKNKYINDRFNDKIIKLNIINHILYSSMKYDFRNFKIFIIRSLDFLKKTNNLNNNRLKIKLSFLDKNNYINKKTLKLNILEMACIYNNNDVIYFLLNYNIDNKIFNKNDFFEQLTFKSYLELYLKNLTNIKFTDTTKCIQIYTSSKIKNIHININI